MTLKGDILIDKDTVLSAVATGKRNGDTDRSLNSFIKTLLLFYWKDEELAKLCLTGAACPSIPGSVPKEKFPDHYADAICRKYIGLYNITYSIYSKLCSVIQILL